MIWPVSFEVKDQVVQNIRIADKELDLTKTYILSVSDYQANGGSGFKMLKPLKRRDIVPVKLRDVIVKEIRQTTAKGDSVKVAVANAIKIITP